MNNLPFHYLSRPTNLLPFLVPSKMKKKCPLLDHRHFHPLWGYPSAPPWPQGNWRTSAKELAQVEVNSITDALSPFTANVGPFSCRFGEGESQCLDPPSSGVVPGPLGPAWQAAPSPGGCPQTLWRCREVKPLFIKLPGTSEGTHWGTPLIRSFEMRKPWHI